MFHPYSNLLVGLRAQIGCSFADAVAVASSLVAEYVKGWVGEASGLGVAVLYGQVMWVALWEARRLLVCGGGYGIIARTAATVEAAARCSPSSSATRGEPLCCC